jgi:Carbohydrate-binding family 9
MTLGYGAHVTTGALILFIVLLLAVRASAEEKNEPNKQQVYTVRRAAERPESDGQWDSPAWRQADTLKVKHFHAKSSDHRPEVRARLLWTEDGIFVLFKVHDRYVVSKHTEYQDPVCRDSCVEFFVQPKRGKGYFNFEVNCGGTLLLYYCEKALDGSSKHTEVPWAVAKDIPMYHSLQRKTFPERTGASEWRIQYFVPVTLLEKYVGPLGDLTGQTWRANFYKCADESSHPHWGAWAPIAEQLDFHQPQFFGTLRFEE